MPDDEQTRDEIEEIVNEGPVQEAVMETVTEEEVKPAKAKSNAKSKANPKTKIAIEPVEPTKEEEPIKKEEPEPVVEEKP